MKRANHGTKLTGSPKHGNPPDPAPQTGKNPHDARDDDSQRAQNREQLGVEEDHKTEDMDKSGRGTYP
jgi:hypothetical protein